MLPEKHRVNRRYFNEVFSKGKFFNGDNFSGKILLSNDSTPARFACVVSKKTFKRAVDRNRSRRRVYSALYPLLDHLKPGFAIIIIAKPSVLTMDFASLQQILNNLLKHHSLIND